MTSTDKSVQRVTRHTYSVLRAGAKRARRIIIRIDRGDLLRFRVPYGRTWFDLPAEVAFEMAVRRAAAQAIANHVTHELDELSRRGAALPVDRTATTLNNGCPSAANRPNRGGETNA